MLAILSSSGKVASMMINLWDEWKCSPSFRRLLFILSFLSGRALVGLRLWVTGGAFKWATVTFWQFVQNHDGKQSRTVKESAKDMNRGGWTLFIFKTLQQLSVVSKKTFIVVKGNISMCLLAKQWRSSDKGKEGNVRRINNEEQSERRTSNLHGNDIHPEDHNLSLYLDGSKRHYGNKSFLFKSILTRISLSFLLILMTSCDCS